MDFLAVFGVGVLLYGLWMAWPPLSLIACGAILVACAVKFSGANE